MAKKVAQQLLDGEYVIANNEILTLTNYRVFRDAGDSSSSRYLSITLDSISSCGLVTTSQPILLVLGILTAVAAFAVHGDEQVGMLIGGAVMVLLFFFTRSAVVAVCSSGGERLTIPAANPDRGPMLHLLNAIDRAKLAAQGRLMSGPLAPVHPPSPPPPAPLPRSAFG